MKRQLIYLPFLLVILLNISNLVAEKQITDNDFRKFVADDFCKEFEAEMAKNANQSTQNVKLPPRL